MLAIRTEANGIQMQIIFIFFFLLYLSMLCRAADIGKISLIPSHNSANVNNGISSMAANHRDKEEPAANYTLLRKEINMCVCCDLCVSNQFGV